MGLCRNPRVHPHARFLQTFVHVYPGPLLRGRWEDSQGSVIDVVIEARNEAIWSYLRSSKRSAVVRLFLFV